jgi:hypothetical protein
MERSEKIGLGVAALGHVLLFGALSLGLLTTSQPKPIKADALDVTLTDEIGLVSTATERAIDPPAPSEAPEQGPPEEAAPPGPAPAPPEPTPAPPKPQPAPPEPAPPKPTPPRPAPPKPTPKPAPPKPTPKPAPPKPKPTPAIKPAPSKSPPKAEAKPAATKPAPAKSAPAKSAPAKSTPAKSAPANSAPAKTGGGKAATAKPTAKPGTGSGEGSKPKPTGSRLGKDFLKGIGDTPSPSKSQKPRAAVVGASQMAGLARLLLEKVKPCYNPPAGGADAGQISTVLNLRLNRDGTVASAEIGDQAGVSAQNQAYARQMADAARRAVLRCAPFALPAELYEGGWDDFGFRFRP